VTVRDGGFGDRICSLEAVSLHLVLAVGTNDRPPPLHNHSTSAKLSFA
jgi:hypothetical protein